MPLKELKGLRIGRLFAPVPIVQGGMGVGVSLSGLASAASRAGCVGVIAAAGIGLLEPDGGSDYPGASVRALRREIRRARELSDGPLGVNIMVALGNFADMVKTAVEEKIDIIFAGAGLPMNLPEFVRGSKTLIAPIVSSARAATLILKRWRDKYGYIADAVVVEGPLAGGHLGFKRGEIGETAHSLERIVPEVVEAVRPFAAEAKYELPVIAGGGVYTGADIRRVLELGASGVQMATRFVATDECDAAPAFKEEYLRAVEGDIEIIDSPVGMPGRAVRNAFLDAVARGERKPPVCGYRCISSCDPAKAPYCIALALINAQRGRLDRGFAFAGANAYRVDKIMKVKELVEGLVAEFRESLGAAPAPAAAQ
ncbi:MAG: nitronate monooxygenase [Spirochaetaceae bacterium]|nr:nitronate monooxygenase [Spirochaetaceae bacterium]